MMDQTNKKCCIVSIVGRPNAGKSTLTNSLVGQKFSIISPKVQTTRTLMRGIVTEENLQIILIDTPGIFKPKKQLEKAIVKTALSSLEEGIDFILHMIDCKKGITAEDKQIIDFLVLKKVPIIAVLNKIDMLEKAKLLPLAKELFDYGIYKEIFMISAKMKQGLKDIKSYFLKNSPFSPFLYPEDEITSVPERILAAEITREKLFLKLNEELPYNICVETETFTTTPKAITMHQVIYTINESHKKIILGKNGAVIKQIGILARKELEDIFARKVHLYLFVKIKKDWMDKSDHYDYLGMQHP